MDTAFKLCEKNSYWDEQDECGRCFVVFASIIISPCFFPPFVIYNEVREETCQGWEIAQPFWFQEHSVNLVLFDEMAFIGAEWANMSESLKGKLRKLQDLRSVPTFVIVLQSPADTMHHFTLSAFFTYGHFYIKHQTSAQPAKALKLTVAHSLTSKTLFLFCYSKCSYFIQNENINFGKRHGQRERRKSCSMKKEKTSQTLIFTHIPYFLSFKLLSSLMKMNVDTNLDVMMSAMSSMIFLTVSWI